MYIGQNVVLVMFIVTKTVKFLVIKHLKKPTRTLPAKGMIKVTLIFSVGQKKFRQVGRVLL